MAINQLPFDPNSQGGGLADLLTSSVEQPVDPLAAYTEVPQEDGSSEYYLTGDLTPEGTTDIEFDANLAEYLDEETLEEIAEEVFEGYQCDLDSREGYEDSIIDAMRLLKSMPDSDDNTVDVDGCDVVHPILMEACTKTQSRASNELLPANGPVKTKIVYGEDEPGVEERALRIKKHMNWQLIKEIPEYYKNSERAYFVASAFGDCFKKKYYDRLRKRIADTVVTPDRLIVNNKTDCLEKADRVTEIVYLNDFDFAMGQKHGLFVYPVDTEKSIDEKTGEEVEVEIESDIGPSEIELSEFEQQINSLIGIYTTKFMGHKLLEQRVYLDLDLDPGAKPYVVTLHEKTKKVLSVVRDWAEDDTFQQRIQAYSHYAFVPSPGFYSWGFVHLLGSSSKTMTAIMRLLIDAGEKASTPMLFKNADIKINGDASVATIGTDKVYDVETPLTATGVNTVGNAIQSVQFASADPVLFSMLQFIEARSQQFADSIENVMENASNYGPVGTTMALLDNAAKFFAAVHKRFHKAQGEELCILGYMNYYYLSDNPQEIPYNRKGQEQFGISREDYNPGSIDIIPVSDPNVSSQAHRLAINNAKLDRALQMPGICNMQELFKEYFRDLGVENPDKFINGSEEPQELSPVEDIIAATNGKPIKAFPDQDHQAHIQVKQAFLQDPQLGGNEMMQQAVGVIQSNIREHLVLQFAADLSGIQQAGQMNVQQASQQYVEYAKFKAAGGAENPEMMAARAALIEAQTKAQELPIKVATEQRQAAKAAGDLLIKNRAQQLDEAELFGKQMLDSNRFEYEQRSDKADMAASLLFRYADQAHESKMMAKQKAQQATKLPTQE
jgi:hypothetical protein